MKKNNLTPQQAKQLSLLKQIQSQVQTLRKQCQDVKNQIKGIFVKVDNKKIEKIRKQIKSL